MPFTSPMPLCIRRARAPMWVLLPRMTPPLSQYRNRTSWSPRSWAVATISSGVIGVPRAGDAEGRRSGREPGAGGRDEPNGGLGVGVGDLLRDDLAGIGQLAAL